MRSFLAGLAALFLPAIALADSGSLDVTKQGLMLRVPGMDAVKVRRDLTLPGAPRFDLYLPSRAGAGGKLPVVVFINGVGDPPGNKLKDWAIYKDWARAVAARGHAAVLHEADPAKPRDDIAGLLEALATGASGLGLDGQRLAIWACSGNVHHALPVLMDGAPRGVRAAVIYYGAGAAKALRKDLPVYWVLAGQDNPGLIRGQRALFARALEEGAPWTMVNAPALPHAFDALDGSEGSRRLIAETLDFLDAELLPLPPIAASASRDILADLYGQRFAAAAQKLEARVAATPRDAEAWNSLGWAYKNGGRMADAVAAYGKAMELEPDDPGAARNYVIAASQAGKCAAAAPIMARLAGKVQDPPYLTAQATCEMLDGKRDAAAATLQRVIASGSSPALLYYNLACALALAGKRDDALDALDKAVAGGWTDVEHMKTDPDLTSLREAPRFQALVKKLAK